MLNIKKYVIGCSVLTLMLQAMPLLAEDLGKYGNTWEIGEQDAVDSIKNKAKRMQADGTIAKRQNEYRDKVLDAVKNPAPLPDIKTAIGYKARSFDPTYTYPEAVKDEVGRILIPAGTKLNPLDYQPMGKRMLFIDGRDERQVAYAKKISDANPQDKVILTAGSFINLTQKWGRSVYFDQRGMLTNHFNIKLVPAMITQNGRLLKIEEGYNNAL